MAIIDGNEILFSSNINICDKLRQEKTVEITQNGPTEITADEGYELSKVTANVHVKAPTQEKTVDITENGTTEIVADEGYLLSKVTANVNVKGSNKLASLVDGSITEITAEDLEGVTAIKAYSFYNCASLTSVTIPDSITKTGEYAFSKCTNIKGVYINDIALWCNISFDFSGGVSVVEYSNPSAMAKGKLYVNDELLTKLVLDGNKISKVSHGAFAKNADLKELIISGNPNIGDYCFWESGLESVNLGTEITKIGNYAFSGCTGLTSVDIPNSVTSIGSAAFYNCTGLTSVTIGDGVTSIGSSAFNSCRSLASVNIGNSVTSIGGRAFYNCNGIKCNIILPDGLTSIGNQAFYNSTIQGINIPNTVTSIEGEAFGMCNRLVGEIIIPNGITRLLSRTFYNTKITMVRIGNGITSISSDAFQSCTALTDIYIDKEEGSVSGAPWGATNATVHWNTPLPSEED